MKAVVSLMLLGLFHAHASAIIGADGKEYHPVHHGHHHKHVAKVHEHASVHAHGKTVARVKNHTMAPAEKHNASSHLRKHKVHMLNAHRAHRHMLNHKTEPKEEQGDKKKDKKEGNNEEEEKKEEEDASKAKKGEKGTDDEAKEKTEDAGDAKKKDGKDENMEAKEGNQVEKEEDKKDKDEDGNKEQRKAESTEEAEKDGSSDWTTKKGGPLPVQGYDEYHDGTKVEHKDTETMTSDWRKEFGPDAKGMTSYREICAAHPDNEWCKMHGAFRTDPHHHSRSDAQSAAPILPLVAMVVARVSVF